MEHQQQFVDQVAEAVYARINAKPTISVRGLRDLHWTLEGRYLRSSSDVARMGEVLCTCLGGDVIAADITAEMIETRWREVRKASLTRYGRAPRPATLNRELALLVRWFHLAVEQQVLKHNPATAVRAEEENNLRRTTLHRRETVDQLLAYCCPIARAWALAGLSAGMRREEIADLDWDRIDEATGVISLFDTKTGTPRRVRVNRHGLAALLKLPKLGPKVFWNVTRNRAYSMRQLERKFDRAVFKAGLQGVGGEKITTHTLRHTLAFRLRCEMKIPERVAMKVLGHQSRRAFDRYGWIGDEEIAAVYEIMDSADEE